MSSSTFAQTIEERFGVFDIEKTHLSDIGFSVLVERVSMRDEMAKIEPDEERSGADTYQREVSSVRILQRTVFAEGGKLRRLDGTMYPPGGDANLSTAMVEAQLIDSVKALYFLSDRRLNTAPEDEGIKIFPVKGGVVKMRTETRWKHPFEMSISQAPGVRSDDDSKLSAASFQIYSEETHNDGRTCFWVYLKEGGIFRMEFNKDQAWCIEEIDFWLRDLTIEEELARKPLLNLTPEVLNKSHRYCTTRTEWKCVDDHWVPWNVRVSYSSKNRPVSEEHEIRYREWKFADEIDPLLLDESSFYPTMIKQSIDFQKVAKIFDEDR